MACSFIYNIFCFPKDSGSAFPSQPSPPLAEQFHTDLACSRGFNQLLTYRSYKQMHGLEDSLIWALTRRPLGLCLLTAPEHVALRYFSLFRADQHTKLNAGALLRTKICHDLRNSFPFTRDNRDSPRLTGKT